MQPHCGLQYASSSPSIMLRNTTLVFFSPSTFATCYVAQASPELHLPIFQVL